MFLCECESAQKRSTKMGKHKNNEQDNLFVSFMEEHKDVARNFVKGDRVAIEALWAELARKLNAVGPPQKDINGWKKVWSDWKGHIKKKIAHNKRETRATGGGPFNSFVLNSMEEKIAEICSLYVLVEGIPKTQSFGVESAQHDLTEEDEVFKNLVEMSDPDLTVQSDLTLQSTPKTNNANQSCKRKRPESLQNILKERIQNEANSTENIIKAMENVVQCAKDINTNISEGCIGIKRVYRGIEKQNEYLAKNVKLLEENNNIHKVHFLKMEKLAHEKNMIKKQQLELELSKFHNKEDDYVPSKQ